MKKSRSRLWILLGSLLALAGSWSSAAQTTAPNDWTWVGGSNTGNAPSVYGTLGIPAPGNTPGARDYAASWTDKNGNFWLFGGFSGNPSSGWGTYSNELWEFSPSNNEWAWIGGGGAATCSGGGICGQMGVYGALGTPAPGNTPGARSNAASWTDNDGNFWLFGGYGLVSTDTNGELGVGVGYLNDLWEYFPAKNQWAWMGGSDTMPCILATMSPPICGQPGAYGTLATPAQGNAPGARADASLWTDGSGNVWLFGGQGIETICTPNDNLAFNDVWEFNPSTLQWAWMAGSSTAAQSNVETENGPTSISIPTVLGTLGAPAPGNTPGASANLDGTLFDGAYWTDSKGNLWLLASSTNALWVFYPSLSEWAWMGGGSTTNTAGVYGTLGTPADGNIPGARSDAARWTDGSGNFWLFGGNGFDGANIAGSLGDLWEWNPSTHQWAWIGGSNSANQSGQYGTLGVPGAQNIPGARSGASAWTGGNGNLWLFGGTTVLSGSAEISNDFWEYQPSAITWPAATPSFSPAGGNYTSVQTVKISDWTPGTTIYYTTDGTTPTSGSAVYQTPIEVSSTQTIQAIAAAGGYSNSAVANAVYTLDLAQPDFSVTSAPTSLTIASGQSGIIAISVTPQGGFAAAVSFACSGLPDGATCSFSPATVTPSGAPASTTLTVTAPTAVAVLRRGPSLALPGTFLAALVCCFGRKKRRGLRLLLLLGTTVFGLALVNACGGQSAHQQQRITSAVTVTGSSGTIQHTATLSLTVD